MPFIPLDPRPPLSSRVAVPCAQVHPYRENEFITYVGLDVHKRSIALALLVTATGEVKQKGFGAEERAVERLIRWLQRKAEGRLVCCYGAGPTGDGLQRRLTAAGIECRAVAPSLVWQ